MCFSERRFNYTEEDTFFSMLPKSKRTIDAEMAYDFWCTNALEENESSVTDNKKVLS